MPKAAPLVTAAPGARNHPSWGRNTVNNRRGKYPTALRWLRHPTAAPAIYWSHQTEIPDSCSYGIHFRPHELTAGVTGLCPLQTQLGCMWGDCSLGKTRRRIPCGLGDRVKPMTHS